MKESRVPLWERATLTLDEASEYTGIGTCTLRRISEGENCRFVLWVGKKRMFKRRKLDEFLEESYSI